MFEKRTESSDLYTPAQWLVDMLGGSHKTKSGASVDEFKAMRTSAVFACVRVLSEGVASLPLPVYQRQGRGKTKAKNHYLYEILQHQPNPEMTSFTFRETMQMHLGLWGNAYSEIEYDGGGKVKALWPLPPNRTTPRRDRKSGKIMYDCILPDGKKVTLHSDQVLHIPGLSFDGLKGLSPIGYARESIGVALATEEFGSRFFENGTNIGAVAEHPGQLSEQGSQNLRNSLNESYSGLGNSHRLMLLEEGMKFHKIGIPPNDAQFLETRKFQVRDIARFYNIRPHMIQDLEDATFSNIEHQGIEHVIYTLRPWLIRWEQNINTKLFTKEGRKTYFAEFLVDALLRGDILTRYQAYAIGRQWGFLSADDIREKENQNPLPDGQGDMYLVPMNMIPAEQAKINDSGIRSNHGSECGCGCNSNIETRGKPTNRKLNARQLRSATQRNRMASSFKPMLEDAGKRIVRRERNDIKRALKDHIGKRSQTSFLTWLENYYENFPDFIRTQIQPVLQSLSDSIKTAVEEELGTELEMNAENERFVRNYALAFASRHTGSSLGQLRALINDAEDDEIAYDEVDQRLDEWEEKRPGKIAMRESTQSSNALAKMIYAFAGVSYLRWVTLGSDACSICQQLDGRRVSINNDFVGRDETLEGEDGNEMQVYKPAGHAPLHQGCVCQIVAD